MKCNECRHKETRGANEYCTYHDAYIGWHGCEYGEPKPQTNADCSRAMTDEELAEWYSEIQFEVSNYYCHGVDPKLPKSKKAWLEWLKSTVEVDNGT